ncbi:uncharacterized protein LOC113306089 [Papaver somniferum]|uniref:uncharacterized protein LOC113306089 n=1 Tax=Papaver somniferum TaxID=3469 RepID=UPI000E6FB669|nr:uncharacterized protein LOC113306089 [Papaver somniferum]
MWNNLNIQVLTQSQSFIHVLVTPPALEQPWLCTGIYGPPHPAARSDFWQDFPIIFPNITNSTSWLLIGDFNEVKNQSEKKGGRQVNYSETQPFLTMIDQMGFINLRFRGDPYTWTNNQQGQDNILERLDRALATPYWRMANPHAVVTRLPRIASDHAPILLRTKAIEWQGQKNYKFEHLWLTHPHLNQVVTSAWTQQSDVESALNLQLKLITTGQTLMDWNKDTFGHLPTLIRKSTNKFRGHNISAPFIMARNYHIG